MESISSVKYQFILAGAFKDDTDILWVKSCWPNANVAGHTKPGSRIEHCDTFDTTSFLTNRMAGGVTLLHEWGHFGYGVYDEYKMMRSLVTLIIQVVHVQLMSLLIKP